MAKTKTIKTEKIPSNKYHNFLMSCPPPVWGWVSSVILNSWILHLNYLSECVILKRCSILKNKIQTDQTYLAVRHYCNIFVIFWNYADLSILYAMNSTLYDVTLKIVISWHDTSRNQCITLQQVESIGDR